jgi:hypothetical protein
MRFRRQGVVAGMTISFGLTWDYRCPFARNMHEHLLAGLAAGADWDVRFLPFCLGQAHVAEGEPSVWDKPEQDRGIVALQAGVVVRDLAPDRFHDVHRALFAARHDRGLHLEDRDVVASTLEANGVDPATVFARIDSGEALAQVQAEHEAIVESHQVWGVPTFVVGDQATFVRVMNRPEPDGSASITAIERIIEMISGWPQLNEFKHTSLPK